MLKEKVIHQQIEIDRFQSRRILMEKSSVPRCPQGWWTYKSSCYQLSSVRDTWQNARQDCESKGAYLVILNDDIEEKVVRSFGAVKMWMGLRCRHSRWTWMDEYPLPPHPSNVQLDCWSPRNCRCANVDGSDLCSETWFIRNCKEHHHWMCEKEPAII
ncbi:C-type lectin domain family 17, member A-like [Seriola aureovittata]|uniref:C-type lectin domain family 17, member A-like n=1 Tax=Seriola aureovittata TaxID=2871759 RepID=UPI0024BDC755|nr:C-type lectin domain family 17, member A-like [Seriola aureovittata]